MKILVAGCGAIGSNLVKNLVPDLRGEHEITILDKDIVEERNVTPGTQWYSPDQIGLPKVEALQFNTYRWFQREIQIIDKEIAWDNRSISPKVLHPDLLILQVFGAGIGEGLVIDCFDNHEARLAIQDRCRARHNPCLHIGFSPNYTFAIEWNNNYNAPSDITSGFDICEMPGAAAFVASVASLGALVAEEFILKGEKVEILGGKFTHSKIK